MFAFVENYKKNKMIEKLEMLHPNAFFLNLSILKDVFNRKNKKFACQVLQTDEGESARNKLIDFLSQCQYALDYDMRLVKNFENTIIGHELEQLITLDVIDAIYPNGLTINEYGCIPKIIRKKSLMQRCTLNQKNIEDEDQLLDVILNYGCEELIGAFHPYLLRQSRYHAVMEKLNNHYNRKLASCDQYQCFGLKALLLAERQYNELTCQFLNMLIENKYPTALEMYNKKDADKIGYINWRQFIENEQEIA